jgi:glycerol-3-phosphate O-acyltransferase
MLAAGGRCIWIAPSGGRDRPPADAPADAAVLPAAFDAKNVEMFR